MCIATSSSVHVNCETTAKQSTTSGGGGEYEELMATNGDIMMLLLIFVNTIFKYNLVAKNNNFKQMSKKGRWTIKCMDKDLVRQQIKNAEQ